jgi:hypothetical protein
MKRLELIRQIEQMGCVLLRRGGRHDSYENRCRFRLMTGKMPVLLSAVFMVRCGALRHDSWYQNPKTGACQPIPRHREIKEHLARHIISKLKDWTTVYFDHR